MSGAVVVAIPYDTDLPVEVEGGAHVTLAYFGDSALSDDLKTELLNIIFRMANDWESTTEVETRGFELLGENDEAFVLALDDGPDSAAVRAREYILSHLPPDLGQIFEESETFPNYLPHMTIRYEDGYDETRIESDQLIIPPTISFKAFALWNGDERLEYGIPGSYLAHYGILRKSGRYPWGSGDNPYQNNMGFLQTVEKLKKQGLSEVEIAQGLGTTTSQLRAAKSIAKNELRAADQANALRLKEKGMSNVAIGEQMGINESSVRALLNPAARERAMVLNTTADMLKDQVAQQGMIDVGTGIEYHLGVSGTKLSTALALLKEEGYEVHKIQVDQLGTESGKKTTIKVLAPPGTTYRDIVMDPSQVKLPNEHSEDGGRTFLGIQPPIGVDPKRVAVKFSEEGGADADGVIYVRPGAKDLDMGGANYAQVRIQVGDGHYLKGMAMYKDDLPAGVDLMFNTNKSRDVGKLGAMKPIKDDPENPFGTIVRQLPKLDVNGLPIPNTVRSAMNIVNEEADWDDWSRNLASQMLSKQTPTLAKKQLGLKLASKQAEYDEIMALTNPAVKKKLLESFADGADSSSVHLKAAPIGGQKTHVILPFSSIKENEIYAPNYQNGEKVVLVRYPHGGTFEIPELTVNNKTRAPREALGNAKAAVGINPKVAGRLSGADFDGDTVLVIPNGSGAVKTTPALAGLKNFDPQTSYPRYEGMKVMTTRQTQTEMGKVSNLITDMTIRGASQSEIARAVRHSMVVIDAEKHKLNFRQSATDNGIAELKEKYQGKSTAGASTLLSRTSSTVRVPERTPRAAKDGGPIDKATGKRVYTETGQGYTNSKGKWVPATSKVARMELTDDAFSLSSGTPMETIYARHANSLKALANGARRNAAAVKTTPYSPSAKKVYRDDVASLDAKLNTALRNKPLERRAQLVANATVAQKRRANPDMEASELKKIKGMALTEQRARFKAEKKKLLITQSEWEAIQAGAISNSKLKQILDLADLDQVKGLATPRQATVMTSANIARAQSMLSAGYTQAEIASALGIPTSTLNDGLKRED